MKSSIINRPKSIKVKLMFECGDIIQLCDDNAFWVVIGKSLPINTENSGDYWKIRRRDNYEILPILFIAHSSAISLVCRPVILANQILIYRGFIVAVIKEIEMRIQCKIIDTTNYNSSYLFNSVQNDSKTLEIIKSALIESSISIFIKN